MAPTPCRPGMPRINMQNTNVTHPVRPAPLPDDMDAVLRPPVRLPAGIVLTDPPAGTRLDPKG